MKRWAVIEGTPAPLGVTYVPEDLAYNVALYSQHATSVTLLLFAAHDGWQPMHVLPLYYLTNKTGYIWHCRIPRDVMERARYYAFVVDGPGELSAGYRFDRHKLLLDPYARAVYFPPNFSREAARHPGTNIGQAPLGVLHTDGSFDWGHDPRPRHAHDTVIYELHVRNFTKLDPDVPPEHRGTYLGLIDKIPYLRELGVTAIELLPIFQYDPQEGSYWGYMPLNFFAPHAAYATDGQPETAIREFKQMIKALHAAGIEVILDVVYNHTAEGDHTGPTYSFRGIDNPSYYLLERDGRTYRNDAGTGNVLRCANAAVRKLLIDSMRFWVNEMHVDGFRFDLASILTRDHFGNVNLLDPAVIADISANDEFAHIRLIAEAWDISTYQLGRSFPGISWLQWNGKYRDDIRSFVRGDASLLGSLMQRIYGSDDLFPDDLFSTYRPYQSVNFITAHDGFCLYDLVSYNQKHNEANGRANTDGTDDNRSWNCGWEGDVGVPAEVLELRRRQIKNFFVLLMLSNGTPMFCAGDEFMNTQGGNNNPYNQDNEIVWLNWDRLKQNSDMFRFFRLMIAFRKAHPSICRSRFWREDVRWYGINGPVDFSSESRAVAFCLHGASHHDRDLYVMINGNAQTLDFALQEGEPYQWKLAVDTSKVSPYDIIELEHERRALRDPVYAVRGRSVVVLVR